MCRALSTKEEFITNYHLKRSYRGETLVVPPGADPVTGEWKTAKNGKNYFYTTRKDVLKYGRASDAGKHLKGGSGLADFKGAHAAMGVVLSAKARSQVATLINEYDGDPYYKGNDGGTQSGKSRLLNAVEFACDVAGASDAAERGTEFHQLWEQRNRGQQPRIVQPHLVGPLDTYSRQTAKIKFINSEFTIVNDELQRAGTCDHLLVVPKGSQGPDGTPLTEDWVVVGDGKTGRWDVQYPAGVYAQVSTYALGQLYDQDTNTRSPIHPDLNTDWGVLIHFPLHEDEPEVGLYWLDLAVGRNAALLNNRLDSMSKYFLSVDGKPRKFELAA